MARIITVPIARKNRATRHSLAIRSPFDRHSIAIRSPFTHSQDGAGNTESRQKLILRFQFVAIFQAFHHSGQARLLCR